MRHKHALAGARSPAGMQSRPPAAGVAGASAHQMRRQVATCTAAATSLKSALRQCGGWRHANIACGSSCPAPALRGRHLVCQPPGLGITHAVILAASCSATPMDSSSLGEDKFIPSEPHQNHGPAHTCGQKEHENYCFRGFQTHTDPTARERARTCCCCCMGPLSTPGKPGISTTS